MIEEFNSQNESGHELNENEQEKIDEISTRIEELDLSSKNKEGIKKILEIEGYLRELSNNPTLIMASEWYVEKYGKGKQALRDVLLNKFDTDKLLDTELTGFYTKDDEEKRRERDGARDNPARKILREYMGHVEELIEKDPSSPQAKGLGERVVAIKDLFGKMSVAVQEAKSLKEEREVLHDIRELEKEIEDSHGIARKELEKRAGEGDVESGVTSGYMEELDALRKKLEQKIA
ncbi:MAG: hypothetical protein HQ536_03820 [Parcubacteria group bacterium]|nr:hypothetical protein [Parcubacteria group bacterium]